MGLCPSVFFFILNAGKDLNLFKIRDSSPPAAAQNDKKDVLFMYGPKLNTSCGE
jgi:hypothetical protein